jgi:hypothetical protein
MRTTLDIDKALLESAMARFPPGTPKTVVVEEALRCLNAAGESRMAPYASVRGRDPRVRRLVDEGRLIAASAVRVPPTSPDGIPLSRLLESLAKDREDR